MAAWSEFVFFNEDPSEALIAALNQGILPAFAYVFELALFYLVPSSFLIGLMGLSGSRGAARVLLLGALTGYSIEGAMVPAVYEAFPISFLWTAVAWHGPITVAFGLFVMPRLIARGSVLKGGATAICVGIAWALWTTWTWGDVAFSPVAPADFMAFAAATTTTMACGYLILQLAGWPNAVLPRWVSLLFTLPSAVFLVLQGLPVPLLGLGVWIIVGLLTALLLWLGRAYVDPYRGGWGAVGSPLIVLISVALSYAVLFETGPLIESEELFGVVFVGGFLVWVVGIAVGVKRNLNEKRAL
ncbi:MAG: hypothetical protein OXC60_11510 [Litoreibacter sp.]|nr:hypothetical protein [Litoreibacter sp.]